MTAVVLTASDLCTGDVVWRDAQGGWTRDPRRAALLDPAAADAALAQAHPLAVVGPYLAAARPGPDGPEPTHFREAFRARGPSNYAHGKQVDLT